MIGAKRRRVPRWSSEQRLCEKVVQQEVSCALDKGNKRGPFQCMQGWKDELLQKHLIKGVRSPMMKGEDTKESWYRWSYQAERHRSSKHRKWDWRLRRVHRNSLFLCDQWQWSFSSPHGGRESWSHWRHPRWRRMWPPHDDRRRHLKSRCEGHDMSPSSDRLMMIGGDTWDGRCEDHHMSPSLDHLMTTGGDTSDGRCENHHMSPSSDRFMTTDRDTSDGRCEFRPSHDDKQETPQEKVWGPWYESKFRSSHDNKWRHLRWKVWGPWYESKIRPSYDDRWRHLGWKVWGPWYESKFGPPHNNGRRHLREGVRAMKGAQPQSRYDGWI